MIDSDSIFRLVLISAITQNIALNYHLGLCPMISISKKIHTSFSMGMAVTLVMVVTSTLNWVLNHYLLVPFQLEFLQLTVFILSAAAAVQLLEGVVERFFPFLFREFGVFLALITVNCAVMGVSLFSVLRGYSLAQTAAYGLGSGLGWTLVIVLMSGIKAGLVFSSPLPALGETGITMVIAAVMAMAFSGLGGAF